MDLFGSYLGVRIDHQAACPVVDPVLCAEQDIPDHEHHQGIDWFRADSTVNVGLGGNWQASLGLPFDVRLLCAIADPAVRVTRVSLDVQKDDPSRRTGVARVWAATPAEASALIQLLRDAVYTDHDTFIVALGASEEARAAGRASLKALGGKLRAWFAAKRGRTDRPTALVNVQLENHHPQR